MVTLQDLQQGPLQISLPGDGAPVDRRKVRQVLISDKGFYVFGPHFGVLMEGYVVEIPFFLEKGVRTSSGWDPELLDSVWDFGD